MLGETATPERRGLWDVRKGRMPASPVKLFKRSGKCVVGVKSSLF